MRQDHRPLSYALRTFLLAFVVLFTTDAARAQPLAKHDDKYLGNVLSAGFSIPASFETYWNQVTPENHGKWGSAEPSRDNMQWTNLDAMFLYAGERGYPFRQHTFVWGQQYPSWIETIPEDEQAAEVEEWIREFGERFPDVDYIDVVNEPLHEYPPFADAMGGAGATGWDWVIWAFEKARAYNPTADLHLNDYNILRSSSNTTEYLQIIGLLQDRGLIDGIAVQGHFMEDAAASLIRSNLNRLAATGLPIYITEYDVNIADDEGQLLTYQEQFPVIWEHESVAGVTLWGYIENRIWRTEAYLVRADGSERPALEWLRGYLAGNRLAGSETPTSGTVSGTFRSTHLSDDRYETLREVEPEGTSPGSYSILEHLWTIDVPEGDAATFFVEAFHQENDEGDDFTFAYSLDGSTFTDMVTTTATSDDGAVMSYALPDGTSGPVQVRVQDADRTFGKSSLNELFVDHLFIRSLSGTGTAIDAAPRSGSGEIPASVRLDQNYPNPFNPSTTVRYVLKRAEHVRVSVFDATGRHVATLADGIKPSGEHGVTFDAGSLPSGVYVYRITTPSFVDARKMVLAK